MYIHSNNEIDKRINVSKIANNISTMGDDSTAADWRKPVSTEANPFNARTAASVTSVGDELCSSERSEWNPDSDEDESRRQWGIGWHRGEPTPAIAPRPSAIFLPTHEHGRRTIDYLYTRSLDTPEGGLYACSNDCNWTPDVPNRF